jgi:hypothetical protein
MGVAVVKKRNYLAMQVSKDLAKKQANICLPDIVVGEHAVQPQALTARADGKSRDDRNPIISEPVTDQWGLTDRCPGLSHRGSEQKAGFIDENQVGNQPLGVFFILFQLLFFHCWMAWSLRSKARLSGF